MRKLLLSLLASLPILTLACSAVAIDTLFAETLTIAAADAKIWTPGMKPSESTFSYGWEYRTTGDLGEYIRIDAAATCKIVVHVENLPANSPWTRVAMYVDQYLEQVNEISRVSEPTATFAVELSAGAHRLTFSLVKHDAKESPGDATLDLRRHLTRIDIDAPKIAAVKRIDRDAWIAGCTQREDRVLSATSAGIEKNRKGDLVVTLKDASGKPITDAKVRATLTNHEFLFGCNSFKFNDFPTKEQIELYRRQLADLFNLTTTYFYWRGYEPKKGEPHYGDTDLLLSWTETTSLAVKGHPLLWDFPSGIPAWCENRLPTLAEQRQRIVDIMTRYKGRIKYWEVVNEPAHGRGIKIDQPYRWARQVDPSAYLIVNDHSIEANGYQPFFDLLKSAIRNGVPFDGIGIQAHEPGPGTYRYPADRFVRFLDKYATLGKELHITEFTPPSGGQTFMGTHRTGVWDEKAQAEYAVEFYRTCFAHPAVAAIVWWDFCDTGAWANGGGMLRADMTPKPVYEAIRKLIKDDWQTRAEIVSDARGAAAFRGFFGSYRVLIERNGQTIEKSVELRRKSRSVEIVVP